jgi:hypothetical protein
MAVGTSDDTVYMSASTTGVTKSREQQRWALYNFSFLPMPIFIGDRQQRMRRETQLPNSTLNLIGVGLSYFFALSVSLAGTARSAGAFGLTGVSTTRLSNSISPVCFITGSSGTLSEGSYQGRFSIAPASSA